MLAFWVVGGFIALGNLGGQTADASTFLGTAPGSINDPSDLLLFEAVDDVSDLVLIGSSEEEPFGLSFPGGDPTAGEGALSGSLEFTGEGTPLFFTVKAGPITGLYSWMSSGENVFDTGDLDDKAKGFSVARVWGGADGDDGNGDDGNGDDGDGGPAVPEPSAMAGFAIGAGLVAFAVRRRRR